MDVADKIKQLGMPGVHQQPETRRYYPDGDVMAHVVGFNSVEDQGQEGVELTFNQQLSGRPGSRRVIKDRLGRVIEDVQAVTLPVDGRDLRLTKPRAPPPWLWTYRRAKSWRWPTCRPSTRTSARASTGPSCATRPLPIPSSRARS
ncbi:hypothetical protein G6F68_016501 [Rhizopus microsporus]|nr:hypothetical protein G6F68_016501 [Rhizopus microsporus]